MEEENVDEEIYRDAEDIYQIYINDAEHIAY